MRPTLFAFVARAAAVFAGALLAVSAFARSGSPAAPAPQPPAKLRFLFLDESAGYYALKINEGVFRQISANPYEISAPYQPPAPTPGTTIPAAPLEIFKTIGADGPDAGQQRRLKIATFTPPTNTPSALIIVTPRPPAAPDAPLDYRVEIIDTNPDDFPGGSIRIINRGRVAMGAQFGAERVVTPPGETRVVRPATDSRHRVFSKIAAQEPTGWKLLSDNISVVRPQSRIFGIFIFSPGGLRHTLTPAELAEFGPPPPGHFWLTFSDTP